jgi:hypothetical protein
MPLEVSAIMAVFHLRQIGENSSSLPFTLTNPVVAIMAKISSAGSSALSMRHNGAYWFSGLSD